VKFALVLGEGMNTETRPNLMTSEYIDSFSHRICPGKELAAASLFMTCAMSLAVFDIKKKVIDGVVIEPVRAKTAGSVR
jgi:hypothetical protein